GGARGGGGGAGAGGGGAGGVRRRGGSAGPARSPSWSVGPVSNAPPRRELRRFRWRARAARPAAAARSRPEARGIRRAQPHAGRQVRSSKTPRRRACWSRARADPPPAPRSTETAASFRQLVRTVILATWGDVAVTRSRGLGATPGAGSSGTTRTSGGTLVPGAAAATARLSS